MSEHRKNYKQWYKNNTNKYTSSFEILKYDDAYIELLEEFPCENSAQLQKKEGECIRLHRDVCVNVRIEGRTIQERGKAYYEVHKEELNAKDKDYYEANKDMILAKLKIHRDANKEQINARRREKYHAKKVLATDP